MECCICNNESKELETDGLVCDLCVKKSIVSTAKYDVIVKNICDWLNMPYKDFYNHLTLNDLINYLKEEMDNKNLYITNFDKFCGKYFTNKREI